MALLPPVFSAQTVAQGQSVYVCGGVGGHPDRLGQSISRINFTKEKYDVEMVDIMQNGLKSGAASLPFLVGASILSTENQLVILGGGATCFSMGTFWETRVFRIVTCIEEEGSLDGTANLSLGIHGSAKVVGANQPNAALNGTGSIKEPMLIPRLIVGSAVDFEELVVKRQPVVIEKLNMGDCLQKWTSEQLISSIGNDRMVRWGVLVICNFILIVDRFLGRHP